MRHALLRYSPLPGESASAELTGGTSAPDSATGQPVAPGNMGGKGVLLDTSHAQWRREKRASELHHSREHRRRRRRRHRHRAYIQSVYFLPSIATLGNAICGFAAIYVAAIAVTNGNPPSLLIDRDPWTKWWAIHGLSAAAYLIFGAMVFDALDGRLARFARHTTDFGGQLDSLADVVSFGAAPAFIALFVFRNYAPESLPLVLSRLIWAVGGLYMSCAAIRLARFNVSNEHGEQHHFSFLGLPSPGAGGAVAAFIIMEQELRSNANPFAVGLANFCVWILPLIVLATGLLMVSTIRYPHIVNRYMRGKRSLGRLILVVAILLLLVVAHEYTLGLGTLAYAAWGPAGLALTRFRRPPRPPHALPPPSGSA